MSFLGVAVEEVRQAIVRATEAKGSVYRQKKVLIFYFEDDTTGAHMNGEILASMWRRLFGIADVTIFSLPTNSQSALMAISGKINRILCTFDFPKFGSWDNLRHLFICVYLGQAVPCNSGVELVSANGYQRFRWNDIERVLGDAYDEVFGYIDSVSILDCCYSGRFIRSQHAKSSQLLASCGIDQTQRTGNGGLSFIERLLKAVRSYHFRGALSVSVEELHEEIQREKALGAVDSLFVNLGGPNKILIPFERSPDSTVELPVLRLSCTVPRPYVFGSLSIEANDADGGVAALKRVVADLMRDLHGGIAMVDTDEKPVKIILGMPIAVFNRLSTTLELKMSRPT
ncbi:hypothetical protein FQN55_005543 [Onygenales sp. PD_40]|nr:hypothetical protein FQN55_005543 [Onygenales sp. PD_40]